MKFTELPPGDPWFASGPTLALLTWLREERGRMQDAAMWSVSESSLDEALKSVGQCHAIRKVLTLLQPESP